VTAAAAGAEKYEKLAIEDLEGNTVDDHLVSEFL